MRGTYHKDNFELSPSLFKTKPKKLTNSGISCQQRQRLTELPSSCLALRAALECQREGQAEQPAGCGALILRLCCHFLVTLESKAKGLAARNPKGCIQAVTYFHAVVGLGFSFPLARQ